MLPRKKKPAPLFYQQKDRQAAKKQAKTYLIMELLVSTCDAGPVSNENSGCLRSVSAGICFAHDPAICSLRIQFIFVYLLDGCGVQEVEYIWASRVG